MYIKKKGVFMRITEEVTDKAMREALVAYGENRDCFKTLDLYDRFNAVSLLLTDIKDHIPELKADPTYIVNANISPHNAVLRQIRLLEEIVDSIEHTANYQSFLSSSRELTLQLISSDYYLVEELKHPSELTASEQKCILGDIHKHHADASRTVIKNQFSWMNMEIEETPITFFSKPKTYDEEKNKGVTIRGYFSSNIETNYREIQLNEHEDAGLNDVFDALSVIHHETVHDQGFQIGRQCFLDGTKTGELYQDGKIWMLISELKTMIPSGLSSAYRAQCIEKVAYEQQALFDKGLQEVLQTSNRPSLNIAACT